MCGILGLATNKDSGIKADQLKGILADLFELSESRGSESSGIAIKNTAARTINVYKQPIRATKLIKTKEYQDFFDRAVGQFDKGEEINSSFAIIGHSRLVTNGTQEDNDNNQPVIKSGGVAVHNGIIVNVEKLWSQYFSKLKRLYEVDTEIFVDLLRLYFQEGQSIADSAKKVFEEIYGAASVAVLMQDLNGLLLATNTGSLYYAFDQEKKLFLFASEKYILSEVVKKNEINSEVYWIKPFTGLLVGLDNFGINVFDLHGAESEKDGMRENKLDKINDLSPVLPKPQGK